MPVIRSAKKKLRKDKKREIANDKIRGLLKRTLNEVKKSPTPQNIKKAVKTADLSAKKHIIHKNKAGRIKSSLSKLVKIKPTKAKTLKAKK